jgi:cyclase
MAIIKLGLVLMILLCGSVASAQNWDAVEFQAQELSPGVWMLHGAGGNHLLLDGPDGPLLVDTDYEQVSEKLLAKVNELTGKAPAIAIATHWHFDHVGGNEALKEAGVKIIAHKNVKSRMASGSYLAVIDHEQPPAEPNALPDKTFSDELTLPHGQEKVEVFHLPLAHTDGDAMVFLQKANVLHTGDVVFFCGYPFIDINAGGSIDGMIAAVEKAIARCDEKTRVIPGHGPLTDRAGLQQYLGVLRDFRQAVAGAKEKGLSLEELLESDVTDQVDAEWDGKMFSSMAFKELVYRSLP